MKNLLLKSVAMACLLGSSLSAFAGDPAPKGWLMVRSGAANTDENYKKEESDSNGKLERVSVLCGNFKKSDVDQLIASDRTRGYDTYWTSTTTLVINLGGTVEKDPLPKNPNHCLINGIKVGPLKGIWAD
ncbi:MAG TPA: hypothetical protein VGN46_02680 [Luteibacter sp.]|jgi:hypothetical protein|uniref:hypothetical protein n=1 Tax=Luteibacter sp. TaxID=1886636 RepID=UPI002F4133A8